LERGQIIKSTGSWYVVRSGEELINCKIKGNFRIKGIRTTNPVAVGDNVEFVLKKEENTGLITKILDRKNYIIRKATNLSKRGHIIAANVDQAMLVVTLSCPETPIVFIDRFLVNAEAYDIPVVLVFNKIDLYDENIKLQMQALISIYEKVGYKCLTVSATEGIGIDSVKESLADKVTVLSGNSGVGKSTLINVVDSTLDLKTSEISDSHHKGKHTTTFAEMFYLQKGGAIIDTPGIKAFGLLDKKKEDLTHFFPEMFKMLGKCQYYNCTHTHEPGCAVKEAVENDEISELRYYSYVCIYESDEDSKYREDIYK